MRREKSLKEKAAAFIEGEPAQAPPPAPKARKQKTAKPVKTQNVYDLLHPLAWPLGPAATPILAEGHPELDRPLNVRLRDQFWQSIDQHCRGIGVDKSRWVREALARQLQAEQEFFLASRKK